MRGGTRGFDGRGWRSSGTMMPVTSALRFPLVVEALTWHRRLRAAANRLAWPLGRLARRIQAGMDWPVGFSTDRVPYAVLAEIEFLTGGSPTDEKTPRPANVMPAGKPPDRTLLPVSADGRFTQEVRPEIFAKERFPLRVDTHFTRTTGGPGKNLPERLFAALDAARCFETVQRQQAGGQDGDLNGVNALAPVRPASVLDHDQDMGMGDGRAHFNDRPPPWADQRVFLAHDPGRIERDETHTGPVTHGDGSGARFAVSTRSSIPNLSENFSSRLLSSGFRPDLSSKGNGPPGPPHRLENTRANDRFSGSGEVPANRSMMGDLDDGEEGRAGFVRHAAAKRPLTPEPNADPEVGRSMDRPGYRPPGLNYSIGAARPRLGEVRRAPLFSGTTRQAVHGRQADIAEWPFERLDDPNVSRGSTIGVVARTWFERLMPQLDLAGVRLHADATADRLACAYGADAMAMGSDILFRTGRFNPVTGKGLALIGHELVHALQYQTAGGRISYNQQTEWEQAAATAERAFSQLFAAPAGRDRQGPTPIVAAASGAAKLVHGPGATPPAPPSPKATPMDRAVFSPSGPVGAPFSTAGDAQPLKAETGRAEVPAAPPAATAATDDIDGLSRSVMRMIERRLMIERERRGVDQWAR